MVTMLQRKRVITELEGTVPPVKQMLKIKKLLQKGRQETMEKKDRKNKEINVCQFFAAF